MGGGTSHTQKDRLRARSLKCTYCHRELLKPELRYNQPYCSKRCFHEHMAYLSDTNALKTFIDEGPTGISYKQMRSMIRWNLVKYDRDAKTFILTNKAQEILEKMPVLHGIPISHGTPCKALDL